MVNEIPLQPKIPGGYILLSRKILESEIMNKPSLYLKVWVWLLLKAEFTDRNGLKKGQVRTSMQEIRESMAYKVGYRKTLPSIKEIRDVLDWLRSPREGSTKGTMTGTAKVTHGQVITIQNYEYYQDSKNYERHSEGHNEGSTKGTVGAQLEVKKFKKEEVKQLKAFCIEDAAQAQEAVLVTKKKRKLSGKRLETFFQFWEAFGYKRGKREAADAWMDIPQLTNGLVEQIVEAARKEAKNRPKLLADGRTPKMAQGWISGSRWEDEDFIQSSYWDEP